MVLNVLLSMKTFRLSIPTASAVVNTVVIATVAASTPLLLNVIKPLIKQVINKFTKKKKEK